MLFSLVHWVRERHNCNIESKGENKDVFHIGRGTGYVSTLDWNISDSEQNWGFLPLLHECSPKYLSSCPKIVLGPNLHSSMIQCSLRHCADSLRNLVWTWFFWLEVFKWKLAVYVLSQRKQPELFSIILWCILIHQTQVFSSGSHSFLLCWMSHLCNHALNCNCIPKEMIFEWIY